MGELRHVGAHGPEQQDVLWRVRQVVLAADDVADLHVGVVDAHREVVERRAVRADDDQVAAQRRRVDLDVAANDVVERDEPSPTRKRMTGLTALPPPSRALRRGQVRAAAHVVRRLVRRLLRLAIGRRAPPACSSSSRPCPRAATARRPRVDARAAASADTARTRPWPAGRRPPGPRPTRCPASAAARGCRARKSSVERASSVSSRRRMNVPPMRLAKR